MGRGAVGGDKNTLDEVCVRVTRGEVFVRRLAASSPASLKRSGAARRGGIFDPRT